MVRSSLKEFLNVKKLWTLQGAHQNSPRFHRGSNNDLLER